MYILLVKILSTEYSMFRLGCLGEWGGWGGWGGWGVGCVGACQGCVQVGVIYFGKF